MSTASVALANGINANLLRRWVLECGHEGRVRKLGQAIAYMVSDPVNPR